MYDSLPSDLNAGAVAVAGRSGAGGLVSPLLLRRRTPDPGTCDDADAG